MQSNISGLAIYNAHSHIEIAEKIGVIIHPEGYIKVPGLGS